MRSRQEFCNWEEKLGSLAGPKLPMTRESQLFLRILEETGYSQNTLRTFDHWLMEVCRRQLESRFFRYQQGYGFFRLRRIDKPVTLIRGARMPFYPRDARNRSLTYRGAVIVDVVVVDPTTRAERTIERDFNLGEIPIMLGSRYCHLHDLSAVEKIALGEDPNDPLGFFIIKGTEKIITNQEKLRENMPIAIRDDN